ncbi:GntR family transcriptional regulator [Bullifex sp.]|uniref:GntR family transcriptional regulator n=1 Tax=Bullifex sp. TaxID=2815808 RepID=UPI002A81D63D|nr:GntR family transcriptional regulator [Bullifex sp.]MDY4066753.1 GntR family transcriptional regulator [Bullifex sp.]
MKKDDSRANIWVYNQLREQIETLVLKPGTELNLTELSESLGVSRSPLRDALLRLERDSLVDIFPQKGTRVSYLDISDIRQERFMRMNLELGALKSFMDLELNDLAKEAYVTRLKSLLLKQKAALISGSYIDFLKADDEMHATFYSQLGYERVYAVLFSHTGNERRIRLLSSLAGNIANDIETQHEAIIDAIARGAKEEALELDRDHLNKIEDEYPMLIELFPQYFSN